jgi:glycosyltransferase involved in cell wall biosynthesis
MTTVSVIIPSYNRKPLVSRAIDSVLQQTFRDFEIIVVDDASTDGTGEDLTQNYGKEIIYRYLPQNCGVAEARNEGIKAAKGSFIAFLDSDDLWYPKKLKSQMDLFNADDSLGLVYSGFFKTDISGKTVSRNTPFLKGMIYDELFWGNCFATSTVIIKKPAHRMSAILMHSIRQLIKREQSGKSILRTHFIKNQDKALGKVFL